MSTHPGAGYWISVSALDRMGYVAQTPHNRLKHISHQTSLTQFNLTPPPNFFL
nr:MAG TPA: hypothetical protein [Caudoviricetes sp.]